MYPTVCQFQDQLMIICDCHTEGLSFNYDKTDKLLYVTHWNTSTNSRIFSNNIKDAFYYLFKKQDRTQRLIDLDREAFYQLACFLNDELKLKKKFAKEAIKDDTLSLNFFVNGENNSAIDIINETKECNCYVFKLIKKVGAAYSHISNWETFWRILFKGTSGLNCLTLSSFEAEMLLDFLISSLQYKW